MTRSEILVFDTGPLSHIARHRWLRVLEAVVADRTALIPDVVVDELRQRAGHDVRVRATLEAGWISHHELTSPTEIAHFAHFASLLVKRERNRGEAGVLALAATVGGIAVVDDRAARKVAERHGVPICPTLRLLCDSIRQGLLTVSLVSALADDLLIGEYHLPFQPGDFEKWARENGMLE